MRHDVFNEPSSLPARVRWAIFAVACGAVVAIGACGGTGGSSTGGKGGSTGMGGSAVSSTGTGGKDGGTGTGGSAVSTSGTGGSGADGGNCEPCAVGQPCSVASSCASFVCTANACAAAVGWSQSYGDGLPANGSDVVIDAAGRVVTAGTFFDSITFGATTLQSVSGGDIFVAQVGSDGTPLWVQGFGAVNQQYSVALGGAPSGEVALTGSFTGSLGLGGPMLNAVGGASDLFAVKLGADGSYAWSQSFHATSGTPSAGSAAVDSLGNVAITGEFDGSIGFGATTLTSMGNGDLFVSVFSATGALEWAQRFGDAAGEQTGLGVAFDQAGDVYVTGLFSGTITFGTNPTLSSPGKDFFLAKLDPTGQPLWSQAFIGVSSAGYSAPWVAVDGLGDVLLSGSFGGSLSFGSNMLTSAGGTDIFVIKMDPTGKVLVAKSFGDASDQSGLAAGDATGGIVIAGQNTGTVDFGGGPITNTGTSDVVVARLDALGNHVFSQGYGGSGINSGNGVVAAGAGALVVGGYAKDAIDFGQGPLTTTGGSRVLLAKVLTP